MCDYHPQRDAVEKCRKCLRLICLEDKQRITKNDIGLSFRKHAEGVYCSSCYYEEIKSLQSVFPKEFAGAVSFIILVFFGGFILLFNVILGRGENLFLTYFFSGFIIVAILMVWLVFYMVNYLNKPKGDLSYAERAHEKLVKSQISQPRTPKGKDGVVLFKHDMVYCMNCGTSAVKNEQICPSCGDALHATK